MTSSHIAISLQESFHCGRHHHMKFVIRAKRLIRENNISNTNRLPHHKNTLKLMAIFKSTKSSGWLSRIDCFENEKNSLHFMV